MISAERIPNNVDLAGNKRLLRALEHWQPKYIQWWRDMGPQGFQDYHQVYVRTAVSVDVNGERVPQALQQCVAAQAALENAGQIGRDCAITALVRGRPLAPSHLAAR